MWRLRPSAPAPVTRRAATPVLVLSGSMDPIASDVGTASDTALQIAANIQAVTIVLTVLPIMLVYPFIQRYFVSGVMLGAVKG